MVYPHHTLGGVSPPYPGWCIPAIPGWCIPAIPRVVYVLPLPGGVCSPATRSGVCPHLPGVVYMPPIYPECGTGRLPGVWYRQAPRGVFHAPFSQECASLIGDSPRVRDSLTRSGV